MYFLVLLWLIISYAKDRCILEMFVRQAQKIQNLIITFSSPALNNGRNILLESQQEHKHVTLVGVCFSIHLLNTVNKCLSFQYGSQLPEFKIMSRSISDQVKRDVKNKQQKKLSTGRGTLSSRIPHAITFSLQISKDTQSAITLSLPMLCCLT